MNKSELEKDVSDGMSTRSMSEKYQKSQTTISYWIKKFGLRTSHPRIGAGYRRFHGASGGSKYKEIDWEKCQKLYDDGCSWRELYSREFPSNAIKWALKTKLLRSRTNSESVRLAFKLGKVDVSFRKRESYLKRRVGKCGGYRENAGRCKKVLYTKLDGTKVWLQGTWEVKLATFFDSQNIKWERNRIGYKYEFEGKEHHYFPDFILPVNDFYVEVKGYETAKDRAKWQQFPFKLHIVKKPEIRNLDFWWKNLRTVGRVAHALACKA